MTEYTPSPAEQLERRLDFLIRELDEFCAMAREPDTADLIAGEAIGIGQARTRCELILSFLDTRKPNQLRIIRNG